MHEVLSIPGISIYGVAKKFEIEESTLRFQLKKAVSNPFIICQSREQIFAFCLL